MAVLFLTFAGCVTSHGRVNVVATTAMWGGALIVGGATAAAGQCKPSADKCDYIAQGDPAFGGTLVVAGAALLGLAVMIHETDHD